MGLLSAFRYIIYERSDIRTRDDIILGSPWALIAILAAYMYFVRVIGPKFMEKREPLKIDWLIKIYNVVQIFWNIDIFLYAYRIIAAGLELDNFSFWCLPIPVNNDTNIGRVLYNGYRSYAYNKIFDLLDTIFFVLRKKNSQITYTHVYHHIIMCISSWFFGRYDVGGNTTSIGVINGLIHVLMYTYYFLSIMGYGKWLWWKKYLTMMQMLQFSICLLYISVVFFNDKCYYNVYFSIFAVFQEVYFLYLFTNFYINAYLREDKRKKKN